MRGRKLLALALTLVLAGAMIAPATYAAEVGEPPLPSDGEVGEPPLPGDDDEKDDEEDKVVDYDALFEEAKASIEALDRLEALDASIKAVDEQIPDWNVWKHVPYAMTQVRNGRVCASVDKVEIACRMTGSNMHSMIIQNLVPPEDGVSIDPGEDYWKQPEVAKLAKMSLPELLAYAKKQSLYSSDAEFKGIIDEVQVGHDEGVATLKAALTQLAPDMKNVDKMSDQQLIDAIKALPDASKYGIAHWNEVPEVATDGDLYDAYVNVLFYFNKKLPVDASQMGSAADDYAKLVVEATKINPDFKVDLSGVTRIVELPDAPATGAMQDEELSATIAKIAVAAVAGIAAVAGVIAVAKRYVFSPLRRK